MINVNTKEFAAGQGTARSWITAWLWEFGLKEAKQRARFKSHSISSLVDDPSQEEHLEFNAGSFYELAEFIKD